MTETGSGLSLFFLHRGLNFPSFFQGGVARKRNYNLFQKSLSP
jgi:hypothetical protein